MDGALSHDGKMSGNRQIVDRYNSTRRQGGGKSARAQEPKGGGGHSGGVHDESGHDEIKHVVGEHGAAHKHIITKGDGGGYSSETHHESGHVHHADHGSMEEAHTHGAHAMDDTDHLPMNQDQQARGMARHRNEAMSSGSKSGEYDFLPGE